MRKALLLTSLLLLSAAFVVAQTSSATDSTQTDTAANGAATAIQGCLSGSDGNYMLTDSSGKTFQLQGNVDRLKDHVGHTIAVTGTWAGATPSGSDLSGNATTSTNNTFQVTSFRHISENCSNPSAAPSSDSGEQNPPQAAATENEAAPTENGMEDMPHSSTAGMSSETDETTAGQNSDSNSSAAPDTAMQQNTSPESSSSSDMSGQTATSSDQTTSTDTTSQPAETSTTGDTTGDNTSKLPQSASPLPLLGLFGLGSLAAGLVSRKRK